MTINELLLPCSLIQVGEGGAFRILPVRIELIRPSKLQLFLVLLTSGHQPDEGTVTI